MCVTTVWGRRLSNLKESYIVFIIEPLCVDTSWSEAVRAIALQGQHWSGHKDNHALLSTTRTSSIVEVA